MTLDDIDKRFDYHAPDDIKRAQHEATRKHMKLSADFLNSLLPESREKSLAFTALEEALMWANAAIARNN